MWKLPVYSLLVFILSAPAISLAADTRVTCPNGHVQYTPCTGKSLIVKRSVKRRITRISTPAKAASPVNIEQSSFKKISSKEGLWQAYLDGPGNVLVKLLITKNDSLIESRNLGTVQRSATERPSKVSYKGPIPMEAGWDWRLVNIPIESDI